MPRPAPVTAITLPSSAEATHPSSIRGLRDASRLASESMKPSGIHHVSICVHDAQRGLEFYRDVLGMTQLPRPDLGPGHWLDAGGQQVHLMEMEGDPPRANHFAIRVDDVDAAVDDLRAQGI